MLFVHLSREVIVLQGDGFSHILPYENIERKLPVLLLHTIKTHAIQSVWVLNGPGSFTTLRLGSLILSTISEFGLDDLKLYSCTKLDIYARAMQSHILPSSGLIFIGQKKNMRSSTYAYGDWSHDIVNHDTITSITGGDYFVDQCEHLLLSHVDTSRIVNIDFDGERLHIVYQDKKVTISPDDLGLLAQKTIKPMYLIEPQIG